MLVMEKDFENVLSKINKEIKKVSLFLMLSQDYLPLLAVLLAMVVAVVMVEVAGQQQVGGQWCSVRVAASPESSWWRVAGVGGGPRRVPVAGVLRLARQHSLELRKGRPPPHSTPPHLLVTACQNPPWHLWAKLPQQEDLDQALEDDDSRSFACLVERLQEGFLALVGVLRWSLEQKEGAPAREYMYNYCGRDLPVAGKPAGGKRMYRETTRLEQELLRLP